MWIKPTGKFDVMNGFFHSATGQALRFYVDSGSHSVKVRWRKADSSYITYNLVDTIPENKWTFVTAVFDSSPDTLKGYKNGALSVTNTTIGGVYNDSTTVKKIGYADNQGAFFHGAIDNVAIYNEALSSSQIQQHFAASAPAHGIAVSDK